MIDIQYLLILQKFREITGGVFDGIFEGLSVVAADVLYFLPFVIYWAVDKAWGKRFIATMFGAELVNALLKLTFCIYRPWIRSDLSQPSWLVSGLTVIISITRFLSATKICRFLQL